MLLLLVTLLRILTLVQFATSQTVPFDAREATIDSVHHAVLSGLSTCREVVASFIARIETLNNQTNAVLVLNPKAFEIADTLDEALTAGNATGSLFCIPVLLKDNYNTIDMPTTGGNAGLRDARPTVDAPSVQALKSAGAVILGKVNLHELALEGLSVSSLGGQTINPYDFTRTPGGSSGGTGASVASSFCVFGAGSDTVNSLRSPASANSLFSIRPTKGLITRSGILPLSYTQDNIGPIGRSMKDVAIALTVMASVGYDPVDNITASNPWPEGNVDYANALAKGSLKGLRLGVLSGFFNSSTSDEVDPVNEAMKFMMQKLEGAGVKLVTIDEAIYNATAMSATLDVQRYEYRELMDQYLQGPSLSGEHPPSLEALYSTSESANQTKGKFLVIPKQYEFVKTALASSTSNSTYFERQAGIQNLTLALASTFASNNLDAIIYPEQTNLVVKIGAPLQSGRNGILAALTGFPVVTVPAGFSSPSETAPIGIPIGMEILGRPWSEEKLLQIGYELEQLTRIRKPPQWALRHVKAKTYAEVPLITPDTLNISSAYPLDTLS